MGGNRHGQDLECGGIGSECKFRYPFHRTDVDQSRGAVLDKLTKRSRGSTTKEVLSKALDSGELAQITVQLTGNPYVEMSRALCLKMGYKAKEKSPK